MTYTVEQGSRRYVAIGSVLLIHLALGFALVTQFAPHFIPLDPPQIIDTFFIPDPPKAVPPPPVPKQVDQELDSTVTTPTPPLALASNPPDIPIKPVILPPIDVGRIPHHPIVPPPTRQGKFTPRKASPRGAASGWATNSDYPRIAIKRDEAGTSSFRATVGTDGRVKACEIVRSSGSISLDITTCKLVSSRARFDPATNEFGEKIVGTYSNSIEWVLPD